MENLSVLKDKPDSMLHWCYINGSNYNILQQMVSRSSIQLCGGCDIDRSYNDLTTMTKDPVAHAMTPLTKETRAMWQCNQETVDGHGFDVYNFKWVFFHFTACFEHWLLFPRVCTCWI